MKKLLVISLLFFSITGCKKDTIMGQGPVIIEARPHKVQQGNIQHVQINGSIRVLIAHGDIFDLEVKGYENLVRAIRTEVINNTLVIEYPANYRVKNDNVQVLFTIPQIPNVTINGSSKTTVIGNYPDKNEVKFHIDGSGEINAGIGNINNMEMNIKGSGKIDAYNFISKNAKATITGSGEIGTTALDSLNATIIGSGQVKYFGNAVVNKNITGSGSVLKL